MSSVSKFKFVSPGIFVNEIDNSQVPAAPDAMGPVIIGRTKRGPALVPTKVSSFEEFVDVFGAPIAIESANDVWRDGNRQGPTYASYAAQAWLSAGEAPVTVVRLLGAQSPDATTAGKAGWQTTNTPNTAVNSNGGAWGLFLCDSASTTTGVTGSLAAVWYVEEGAIALTGTIRGTSTTTASINTVMESTGPSREFRAVLYNSSDAKIYETLFNFDRDSSNYIRKVFNTNPQLVNGNFNSTTKNYWLGQTYERHVEDLLANGTAAGDTLGVILPLQSGSVNASDFRGAYMEAKTGYVFSQDLSTDFSDYEPASQQQLFRFCARDTGEELSRRFKVAISNIRPSQVSDAIDPYGTFDVEIRLASDTDQNVQVIERFTGLNLNPNSLDYIALRIGDKYLSWSSTEKRFRYYGNFDNVSRYVRLEMNTSVDAGTVDAKCLPFGAYGPVRYNGFTLFSGSTVAAPFQSSNPHTDGTGSTFVGNTGPRDGTMGFGDFVNVGPVLFTASYAFPKLALRVSASDGGMTDLSNAYFGPQPTRTAGSTRFDEDYVDYVRALGASPGGTINNFTPTFSNGEEYSYIFTLDDIVMTGSGGNENIGYYVSGSRVAGTSWTAVSGASSLLDTKEVDRFILPLFGGFDGLDITEIEPFRNSKLNAGNEDSNYAFHTVTRAIDMISDSEEFEFNLATMPNVQNESLTSKLMSVCEDRGDALAIIDLKGDYLLASENTESNVNRAPNITTTLSNLKARGVNSSYGCCFFPYVQIRDNINGAILDCPPSVVALGTFASSQAASKLWFAPAGFNRGGLSTGAGGIPVIGVKQRLNSKDRDKLYAANINPIATFPSEGIVVFGQKTLQVTPSALDRINVRRLLIFVKKEISRIASTVLFDQNVEVTWSRFRNRANTFLSGVKSGLGLSEYKVILDQTTTTPDLIDRNAVYAKIFLKPARSIEFIAIDFVITRTGAAFED
jgi:hypothetical protein